MGKFHRNKFLRPSFISRRKNKSIGYEKCSTSWKSNEAKIAIFKSNGCNDVFLEPISDIFADEQMHQLKELIDSLEEGDELVVQALFKLGTNQTSVLKRLNLLQEKGVHIRTLDGVLNTKRLGLQATSFIKLLTGLHAIESSIARERVLNNIQIRKEAGRKLGGRPKTKKAKEDLVIRLRKEGFSYRNIREQTGLALSTIRRIIVDKIDKQGF